MITNPEESANALTKLADLVGKQTLVVFLMITIFTTGFLYLENREIQELRLKEMNKGHDKLIEEIKNKVDKTIPELDTTIYSVRKTLNELNKME